MTNDSSSAPSDARDRVVAALDLGSNTLKMTLGRLDAAGHLVESGWASATVRLGIGTAETGRLADDRIAAALATLRQFATAARAAGATSLIGVATEATRTAENGPAFLARLRDEIGWEIQPISGQREAELTFQGVARSVDVSGTVVIADIGGGSTEVIVARDRAVVSASSRPLGSGALTDRFVRDDPPTAAEIDACRRAAQQALAGADLPDDPETRLIAVGGTGEYLGRLVDDPTTLRLTTIDSVLDELTRVRSTALASRLTIPEARARVLPAGIAVVAVLAEGLGDPLIGLAPSGIRTGLLMDAFGLTVASGSQTA